MYDSYKFAFASSCALISAINSFLVYVPFDNENRIVSLTSMVDDEVV